MGVADDSIESRHIKDGTIKAEDLDPIEFSDIGGVATDAQIPTTVVRNTDLDGHINAAAAHLASAIVVSGSFVNFVPTNVQDGLQKLDAKLAEEIVNRKHFRGTPSAQQ